MTSEQIDAGRIAVGEEIVRGFRRWFAGKGPAGGRAGFFLPNEEIRCLLAALESARAREAALVTLASELVEMEHGARAEQMQALHRLGVVVTLDEHLARARAFADEQHAKIVALAATAPDAGVGR